MKYSNKLALSYYNTLTDINEAHGIYLVQHRGTKKIYIKKILDIYNIDIYHELVQNPIRGIPKIIEFHEMDNQLILIEDYVSGQTMEELISSKTSMDINRIIQYILELCDILHSLHNMKPPVIHRDIKPSNIIITEYNHVVLLDFNAAKFYSPSKNRDTILLGTFGYAAPEQCGYGTSSNRSDIYSTGILLKELSLSLPAVPDSLLKIIEKSTNLNPDYRYSNVNELASELKLLTASPCPVPPSSATVKSFAIPGFRTHCLWKMLLAFPSYGFILLLALTLNVKDTGGLSLWFQRLFSLLMLLLIIFATFNYRNIHEHFPLCRHKKLPVKILGILLMDILIFISLIFFMAIIVSFRETFMSIVT